VQRGIFKKLRCWSSGFSLFGNKLKFELQPEQKKHGGVFFEPAAVILF
jgi:hypothetical protein